MEIVRKVLNAVAAKTGVVAVRDRLPRARDARSEFVLDLPGSRQLEDFSCGAIAAVMVVEHLRRGVSVDRIYRLVAPHVTWGASTRKVATALRKCGVRVGIREHMTFEDLSAAIHGGHPVIVCVKASTPGESHWAVAYGVGERPRRVFLAGVGLPHLDDGKIVRWAEFRRRLWSPPGNGLICSQASQRRR